MALCKHDFDVLYCEETIENDDFNDECSQTAPQTTSSVSSFSFEDDNSELETLLSKEKDARFGPITDGPLLQCRREAVAWILSVRSHYGFAPLTGVLAVDYFDRFVSTPMFQRDKPWMCQLTAVACLSLAAKVEEPFVPLLVDLQVLESKYIFEAKTIKRMEILVLSSLQWRMHPVTAISFFNHFAGRVEPAFRLKFLGFCERVLVSLVSDSRASSFRPSVTATAIMLLAMKEIGSGHRNRILEGLRADQEQLYRCCELVEGAIDAGFERTNWAAPTSPNAVIDGLYSSDSSNDSWPVGSSLPSRKRKSPDQLTRLPPAKRMFVGFFDGSF